MATKIQNPDELSKYTEEQIERRPDGIYLKDDPKPMSYTDEILNAYKSPELDTKYNEALDTLKDLQSQVPGYLGRKSSELREADPELQQLIDEQSKYQGEMFSAPLAAREKYANIFDPNVRRKLVAQATGNIMGKLSGTQARIGQRQGTADQRAQTAMDLLTSQIGLAETGLQAAGQERDFFRTLVANEYKPKGAAEWADIEKALALDAKYDTSGSGTDYSSGIVGSVEQNNRGGMSYFNKSGKPITAYKFAKDNNMSVADVLAGSRDPGDQNFVDAYWKGMQSIGGFKDDGTAITEKDVMDELKAGFSHIFDDTNIADAPAGTTGTGSNIQNILSGTY